MKRGALMDRGIALAITLAFMTFVRPDPEPSRVGAAIVAILIYETVRWISWFLRRARRREKRKENRRAMHYDATRWADEWITPAIREVS